MVNFPAHCTPFAYEYQWLHLISQYFYQCRIFFTKLQTNNRSWLCTKSHWLGWNHKNKSATLVMLILTLVIFPHMCLCMGIKIYLTPWLNICILYNSRDVAGHERFGHMTRVYYKYAWVYWHITLIIIQNKIMDQIEKSIPHSRTFVFDWLSCIVLCILAWIRNLSRSVWLLVRLSHHFVTEFIYFFTLCISVNI